MGSFAKQLAAFAAESSERADQVVRVAIQEVGARIIERSPVDSGHFVSNWNYSLETPDRHVSPATNIRTINGLAEMPKAAAGFVHYLSNGVQYGHVIEFGGYPNPPKGGRGRTIGGFSTQAPRGVVGLTALEWEQIVAGAVKRVIVGSAFGQAVAAARSEGAL